jgi:hypothetical protein
MNIDNSELVEKYNQLKSLAENEFPPDNYSMEITTWTDGDFQITAFHNRVVLGGSRWSCKIRISSEDARNPSEPYRHVTYQRESNEKEYTIWSDLEKDE